MTTFNTTANKARLQPEFAAPCGNAVNSTVALNADGSAPIVSLRKTIRPHAVPGLVVAVVVLALNLQTWLPSRKHIIPEIGKVLPSLTNANATPTVILPTGRVFTPATLNHLPPHLRQGMPRREFASAAMFSFDYLQTINQKAPTRVSVTTPQVKPFSMEFLSAFASASPNVFELLVGVRSPLEERDHLSPAKFLTNEVLAPKRDTADYDFSLHVEVVFNCGLAPFRSRILLDGAHI